MRMEVQAARRDIRRTGKTGGYRSGRPVGYRILHGGFVWEWAEGALPPEW